MSFRTENRSRPSFNSVRTILALVLREMSTTYGRSAGGYAWAVIEPAAGIALMSIVFSFAFRSPALGTNFPIFYATGFLPFVMYQHLTSKVAQSIRFSRPLLFYPRVTFIDALIARSVLTTLTNLTVFYIVILGIRTAFETHTLLDLPQIILSLSLVCLLGTGLGIFNCFLSSMVPPWEQVWSIINRPMFIISGVFFIPESLPRLYQDVLWYNPLMHVIAIMRRGFYPGYDATWASPLYVAGFGMVAMFFGLLFLGAHHRRILNF